MYEHCMNIETSTPKSTIDSRLETPVAIHQKFDIVDLTISLIPGNATQIEEDEFHVEDGILSTSQDTDIISIEKKLDQLIMICLNNV
jgi:hypothetical protein